MDSPFHYPPELMSLLIDTIAVLCRSKDHVLLFFRGAGVQPELMRDVALRVERDRDNIKKTEIARTVLTRLNEGGDATLRQRREIVKRVAEFEDFSTCWPTDQLKAKGLVAEVRRVVNVKDSFTRIHQEWESERRDRQAAQRRRVEHLRAHKERLAAIRADLLSLFGEADHQRRGRRLEGVLNSLFHASGIRVCESFTLANTGEGVTEQVDGLVEMGGHEYLVEMKWLSAPVGPGDVAEHLVRVFARGEARGIFISASRYTPAAIDACRAALRERVNILCTLEEVVRLLEREGDVAEFFRAKVRATTKTKEPFVPLVDENTGGTGEES